MDRLVVLSEIEAAGLKLRGAVFSIDDAYSFLSNPDPEKSNATRFICWMIVLRLTSHSDASWPSDLFSLYQKYHGFIQRLSNPMDPLASISNERESQTISSDVSRGMCSFRKHATDLTLGPFLTADAEHRIVRILALLSLNFSELDYTQSYDRYCFITYLLTLAFCAQTSLPPAFAEAMCFHLSREWLSIVDVSKFLQNPNATELHFKEMDDQLMLFAPGLMVPLLAAGHGSIHFAFRWELLCFADEHSVKALMLIWDHILLHRRDFKAYMAALCFAHIRQVPPPAAHEIVIEKLQGFRDWNVRKILDDAETFVRGSSEPWWGSPTFLLVILGGFLLLVYFWKR
jgi:hypothetical protein